MPRYIFVVGRSSDLARQEIINLLSSREEFPEIIGPNFIIAPSQLTAEQWMADLGGTIKIAEFIEDYSDLRSLSVARWQQWLQANLNPAKKNTFGFSLYDAPRSDHQFVYRVSLETKKNLQAAGYKIRLVANHSADLSSVVVTKNHLLDKELIIIKHQNKYWLGLTRAVQDFSRYSQRDYGRPGRDDRSGLLPPKVAQMMINLAGADRNKNILDPFCGSGTVLQEAWLLGFKKIIGSDISPGAIQASQKNLDWLKNKLSLTGSVDLKICDVKNLYQCLDKDSVDLIVSEPFLGSAVWLNRQNDPQQISGLEKELSALYQAAFRQFHLILKNSGQVVFIFPLFHLGGTKIPVLEAEKITALGWEMIKPSIRSDKLSSFGNLTYSREGQKVQREITVWRKISKI